MVRRQFCLSHRQDQLLKQLARQHGVSEAERIRQVLEREAGLSAPVWRDSRKALEAMIHFARSLRKRPALMQGKPDPFGREEIMLSAMVVGMRRRRENNVCC